MQSNWLILTYTNISWFGDWHVILFFEVCVCVPKVTYFPKGTLKNRASFASQGTRRSLDLACQPPWDNSAGWLCAKALWNTGSWVPFPCSPVPPLHTLTSSRLNMSDLVTCTSQDSWGTRGRKDQGLPRKGRRFEGGAPRREATWGLGARLVAGVHPWKDLTP